MKQSHSHRHPDEAYIGYAVFIDDEPAVLVDESAIAKQMGFRVIEISEPQDIEKKLKDVFLAVEADNLSFGRICIFVDNRMPRFADYWIEGHGPISGNVRKFKSSAAAYGRKGEYAGINVCEWIVEHFSSKYTGFNLMLFSGFPLAGSESRARDLALKYTSFTYELSKIAGGPGSGAEYDHRKIDFDSYMKKVAGDNTRAFSGSSEFPYAKTLLSLTKHFAMDRSELARFLQLSEKASSKIEVLLSSPSQFELDTVSWHERVQLCYEIYLILNHDLRSDSAVSAWLRSSNEITGGRPPRELLIGGQTSDIARLRNIIRYEI